MRILGVFDKFKDSFSAHEACLVAKQAVEIDSPEHEIECCPLTDGGEGFVEILTAKYNGLLSKVKARDSLGKTKAVFVGEVSIDRLPESVKSLAQLPDNGRLLILEMASVCGLSDLDPTQRNPWHTSTLGVGDLLQAAKEMSADCILLGIGGSSTNDAGIGALSSLGVLLKDRNGQNCQFPSPSAWNDIVSLEKEIVSLPPIRIACDVDNVLLGKEGATHQFGPQKGLPVEGVDDLELSMRQMVNRLSDIFPAVEVKSSMPGSGAAGGIGFGLSLVADVCMVSGFELVSHWLMLEQEISKSDLVLTGEGRFDQSSFHGKGPHQVLKLADRFNKSAVLFCGAMEQTSASRFNSDFPRFKWIEISQSNLTFEENIRVGSQSLKQSVSKVLESKNWVYGLECPTSREERFKRIRRLKKILRPLPRRSNVHRYPVLKWFSETAYRRSYLWSFKGNAVRSALFWGIWISMLPIVGIQMIVVFFVSLLVRANLPLIVALQWISNPLTMGPIYFADYKIGMILLDLMGINYPRNKLLNPDYDWAHFTYKELLRLIDTFPPMFLGGSVLGIFLGVTTVFLYKIFSRFYIREVS